MVLKTFNLEKGTYDKFSNYCKDCGISMSKQINTFIQSIIEEEPQAKQEYLAKLEMLRKQRSIYIGGLNDFNKKYGIK